MIVRFVLSRKSLPRSRRETRRDRLSPSRRDRPPPRSSAGERVKVTAYVSHEDCSRHDTGWSHPDHQGRLPAVTRAVYRDMVALYEPLLQVEALPATEPQLLRVHTRRY